MPSVSIASGLCTAWPADLMEVRVPWKKIGRFEGCNFCIRTSNFYSENEIVHIQCTCKILKMRKREGKTLW